MATINAKSTTANTAEKTTTDAVKSTVEKAGASVKAATDKVVAAVKPVEEKATETVKKVADTVKPVAEKAADTVKTTAKKTASKAKSAVKKTAAKAKVKAASGKDDVTTKVYVQYAGNEVLENDVLERVKEAYVAEGNRASGIKSVQVYLKPEENAAYYVINNTAGRIDLF